MNDHDTLTKLATDMETVKDQVFNHIPSEIRQLRQWAFVGFGGIGAALVAALVKLFVG